MNDPNNPEGTGRYEPTLPLVCFRCAALHGSERSYANEKHAGALIHLAPLVPRKR